MTKSQIQSAWKKVIKETHNIPDWETCKRNTKQYQKVVMLRELLLFCQVLLNKIESGENNTINNLVFTKTLNFYCVQMEKYA